MFSNTLSFLSSRNVNDQVSHPYKTTGKVGFTIEIYYDMHGLMNVKLLLLSVSLKPLYITTYIKTKIVHYSSV